jgi:hypothetical protein
MRPSGWSRLACRAGHLVPIWQPHTGSPFGERFSGLRQQPRTALASRLARGSIADGRHTSDFEGRHPRAAAHRPRGWRPDLDPPPQMRHRLPRTAGGLAPRCLCCGSGACAASAACSAAPGGTRRMARCRRRLRSHTSRPYTAAAIGDARPRVTVCLTARGHDVWQRSAPTTTRGPCVILGFRVCKL